MFGVGVEEERGLELVGIDKIGEPYPTPLEIEIRLVDLFQSDVGELHQLERGVGRERKFDLYGRVVLCFVFLETIGFEENDHFFAERSLLPQLLGTHGRECSNALPHLIEGAEIRLEGAGGSDALLLFHRYHLEGGDPFQILLKI